MNSISADQENKQGADAACENKGKSAVDPWKTETVFYYYPDNIRSKNHQKNIEQNTQKKISCDF